MDKKTLDEERTHLSQTLDKIEQLKTTKQHKIHKNEKSISDLKSYFADSYYDVHSGNSKEFGGEDEFANVNISIENFEKQNENLKVDIEKLTKQKKSPYFGRFDFSANGTSPSSYYIGLGFVQNEQDTNWVYDWRADVCSLYYDDKIGKTSYFCPDGEIAGNLTLKRQFKITNGKLAYYIDSNMLIDDDILMEQLSKNATSKMHEIVSTIQKEQNVLIRSDDFDNVIVQGVAGSGKTSIAMHRVSYLLYKYRKELKSEDILILSPSQLFANYIDDVLPSLGEERTFTTTFTQMAKRLLGLEFETREVMLERVISKQNQQDFENIAIKSSFEFLDDLKTFLNRDMCNLFIPKTLAFGDVVISKDEIHNVYFDKLGKLPIYKRIDILAESIADKFKIPSDKHPDLVKRAKKILYNNFITTDLLRIYNLFLRSLELDEIETIGAYDVAPVLLIKENLFGLKNNYDAKYVIVDEMQDYTPCHFYLFDKIWRCAKLYLGDINQSIDKTLPPSYLPTLAKLTKSKIKYLNKSYRSTLEISIFSQKILGKHIANNVNRSGEPVECIKTANCAKAIEKIVQERQSNPHLQSQSIAIICKSEDEIKKLQRESDIIKKFKILNDTKTNARHLLTTPAKAKGVEFDCVIVPFATQRNFHNELDRNLLYVASTRALHKLYFLSDDTPSKFLLKTTKKS